MSSLIQTVENVVATKLREIEGLNVYEVRPPRGFPLPSATLQLIFTRIRGGFPDKMQYLDVSFQVDIWARVESQMRGFADKALMKLYEARAEMGFIDVVPWGGRDLPEEDIWRRSFDLRVTTTITKS